MLNSVLSILIVLDVLRHAIYALDIVQSDTLGNLRQMMANPPSLSATLGFYRNWGGVRGSVPGRSQTYGPKYAV